MCGSPLPYLYAISSQGLFPDDWKCAKVTALFKQGNRDDLNNYRPISVISVVAKVFERIVSDQLHTYREEHDIICKYQSSFCAIHSTATALLEATDTWRDRGEINAVIFPNLKKALVTVEGALLFLLDINDLPNCLSNCEPRMYADDTYLTYAGDNADNIQLHLNPATYVENVHNWLIANKLTLNMTKTEFMLLGSKQRLSTLTESPTLAINDFQYHKITWSDHRCQT